MSKAFTRWFIIVDRTKKCESLARPRRESSAGAESDLVWHDKDLAKDIVDVTPGPPVEADVEHSLAVSEEIH
jgi:hypothetical protein